ncbi:hypothetical protein LCGC14_0376210 [marine sediment metagenome]|uniref:Uncharacterized protein n=1 Tax=marine sediment metagenome TaxID=412755 RepID=A0A0F9WCJ7_9ZZZZ
MVRRYPRSSATKFQAGRVINAESRARKNAKRYREQIEQLQTELTELKAKTGIPETLRELGEARAEVERLRRQPRCPCGEELEGLGIDINTKEEVWQCKGCQLQMIIEKH